VEASKARAFPSTSPVNNRPPPVARTEANSGYLVPPFHNSL
jgi:hypothetical protein